MELGDLGHTFVARGLISVSAVGVVTCVVARWPSTAALWAGVLTVVAMMAVGGTGGSLKAVRTQS